MYTNEGKAGEQTYINRLSGCVLSELIVPTRAEQITLTLHFGTVTRV